ncbi:hypothetical protein DXX93_06140 [Thalassotalea euphylliae]|uniref:Elongation factor Ts n=1 Tax=Thalassotalea euphylliae TaxID=1655234 RepID=A0A3E0TNV4_9GAMM|nr:hypothetical protein [Thalassotalea euphylliae]REL26204.1 hypothetical protein DXX93_06140 [Thalassotalea euphylliae]
MGTEELQHEIKSLLAKLNWSQKRLGSEVYLAKYDDEDEYEIKRYEEKVKKDLSRRTTKPELLMSYLEIISQHNELKKLDLIVPSYCRSGLLSNTIENGMSDISKLISKLVCE